MPERTIRMYCQGSGIRRQGPLRVSLDPANDVQMDNKDLLLRLCADSSRNSGQRRKYRRRIQPSTAPMRAKCARMPALPTMMT